MQSGFRSYAGWEPLHVECETHLRTVKPLEKRRMNMNRLFLVMMLLGGFAATCSGTGKVPSDQQRRIEDNINLPFANDEAVLGAGRALILSMSPASSIRSEGTSEVTCT